MKNNDKKLMYVVLSLTALMAVVMIVFMFKIISLMSSQDDSSKQVADNNVEIDTNVVIMDTESVAAEDTEISDYEEPPTEENSVDTSTGTIADDNTDTTTKTTDDNSNEALLNRLVEGQKNFDYEHQDDNHYEHASDYPSYWDGIVDLKELPSEFEPSLSMGALAIDYRGMEDALFKTCYTWLTDLGYSADTEFDVAYINSVDALFMNFEIYVYVTLDGTTYTVGLEDGVVYYHII